MKSNHTFSGIANCASVFLLRLRINLSGNIYRVERLPSGMNAVLNKEKPEVLPRLNRFAANKMNAQRRNCVSSLLSVILRYF